MKKATNMIIVKIIGGLTSQMHKYALGKALALQHNVPLKLDLSWFENNNKTDTPWPYQLSYFNIKADIATPQEINSLRGNATLARRIQYYLGINLYKKSYVNKNFISFQEFKQLGNTVYLEGEWAGFQYFSGYEKEILKDLTLTVPLSPNVNLLLDEIGAVNAVSLHVRRGDYISNKGASEFHCICPLEYYDKAIAYMMEHVENPKFFIFSDDIDWVKENLKYPSDSTFIEKNQNFEDLLLMSKCKYNIIANSGFSVWGSWLNTYDKKIVIAPKKWVTDEKINTVLLHNLIQKEWKIL